MSQSKQIQIFEYGRLVVGESYGENKDIYFKQSHLKALAIYLTRNPKCPFYTLYYNSVKFSQYVGVIQVDDITIEVLPKTDSHSHSKATWQQVLIKMLFISLHVNARTTTMSAINIKQLSVLEAYISLFIHEVETLMRHGLVKKYRTEAGNQTSLRGRLLIDKQVTKNLVHKERFYVAHQLYDRNNLFNSIIMQTLDCINCLSVNSMIMSKCRTLLLDFPECNPVKANHKIFNRLLYDRKTERYRTAIELARVILLSYHPDFRGGRNNLLAIMVDMNQLWENYVYFVLRRACMSKENDHNVWPQQNVLFWKNPTGGNRRLKPDLVLEYLKDSVKKRIVLDTKWKYESAPSVEDVRQMYTYNHYFQTDESYLLYPDKNVKKTVSKYPGNFYNPSIKDTISDLKCGLMYIDLLDNEGNLDFTVGERILDEFAELNNIADRA